MSTLTDAAIIETPTALIGSAQASMPSIEYDDIAIATGDAWAEVLLGMTTLTGEYEGLTDEQSEALHSAALATRRTQIAATVPDDDDTRLNRAFAALSNAGVLARAGFTCCNTCAYAEIADERDHRAQRLFIMFNSQTAERLIEEPGEVLFSMGLLDSRGQHTSDQDAVDREFERVALPILKAHGIGVRAEYGDKHAVLTNVRWFSEL